LEERLLDHSFHLLLGHVRDQHVFLASEPHGAIAIGLQQQAVQDASQPKSQVLSSSELIGWKHGAIALGLQQQKVQDASHFKSNFESMVGSMVPSP
jgi:hypothetical protein